jgi:hypothetical protein
MSTPTWMDARPIDAGRRHDRRRSTDRRTRVETVLAAGVALLASMWGFCVLAHYVLG